MWRLVTAFGLGVLFVGCTVNQDLMFRTDSDHVFESLNASQHEAYTLSLIHI